MTILKVVATVTIVVGMAVYFVKGRMKDEGKVKVLKAGYTVIVTDVSEIDPGKIDTASQYYLLQNLLSTLVTYNQGGELVSFLAKKFEWQGDDLRIELRDVKTVDGHSVTAMDVEFSLKRLIIKSINTHGNLKDILCPDDDLKTVEDKCAGIEVLDDKTLLLRPSTGRSFLLPMLTSLDFGILRKGQVDPKTLEIIDHRNTSGAYYIESIKENGFLTFKANPFHWEYAEDIPQEVLFKPWLEKDIGLIKRPEEQFIDGEIDYLPSTATGNKDSYVKANNAVEDSSLSKTFDLARTVLFFTERGKKELSAAQRRAIGSRLRPIFTKHLQDKAIWQKPTTQFLGEFGEGALSDSQVKTLDDEFRKSLEMTDLPEITIVVTRPEKEKLGQLLLDAYPKLKIETDYDLIYNMKSPYDSDAPHVSLGITDTSWNESISLLSYSLSMEHFHFTKEEGKKWLKEYIQIEDKAVRMRMLTELHYNALVDASIVPVFAQPYISVIRNSWREEKATLFPTVGLWQVHQN